MNLMSVPSVAGVSVDPRHWIGGRRVASGDTFTDVSRIGPNITRQHLDRVDGYVRRAIVAGAHPVLGGGRNTGLGGLYYQPTLLTGAEPGAEILTEEVFGPALTLQTFRCEDEAVEMANATPYGLAATVFTGDERRAGRVRAGCGQAPCGSTASSCGTWRHRSAARVFPGSAGRVEPGASTSTAI
jgi:acyl-CoA reductase-like NAD-dependent aldehyde dehydrogenase